MKKIAILILITVLAVWVGNVFSSTEKDCQQLTTGVLDVSAIAIQQNKPEAIYIGAKSGIFKTTDAGKKWRRVFSLRGSNRRVNFLLLDYAKQNVIYAATAGGLFLSNDYAENWQRIFKGKDSNEDYCTSLVVDSGAVYLGTKAGLFVSEDNGRLWHRENGELGKSNILALASNPKDHNYIYVASVNGVFRYNKETKLWDKVFVALTAESEDESDEEYADSNTDTLTSSIRYIVVSQNNPACVYLATNKGVYQSFDNTQSWRSLAEYGLLSNDVSLLLESSSSNLYAIAKGKVFLYRDNQWNQLQLDTSSCNMYSIASDNKNNLYIGTDRGLFKAKAILKDEYSKHSFLSYASIDEPGIKDVQAAAIEYAEVSPEKIKLWRKQASKKAFLPQLSVDVDRDSSELWHWESGSSTKGEDDVLRKGRDNIEWGVSLSWDLGDIIWNDAQTSIDVRSRLMVQLRDDVLDEVTKLYFERLRVKNDLSRIKIEDINKRQERELKLQELTASLDALTGGYFSANIAK